MRKLLLLVALSSAGCGLKVGTNTPGVNDNSIFPLNGGRTWTYKTTGTCIGTSEMQVLGEQTKDNRSVYEVTMPCNGSAKSYFSVSGDTVQEYNSANGFWSVFADSVLTDGREWSGNGVTYKWHPTPVVTTPVAAFANCWTRTESATQSYLRFCRSVGIVEMYKTNGLGVSYGATLSATSFTLPKN